MRFGGAVVRGSRRRWHRCLRATTGTVTGLGGIDLGRGALNTAVGTERTTAGSLALVVPVRPRGTLRDLSVGWGHRRRRRGSGRW